MRQRCGDLGKGKGAASQGDLLAILVVAQVQRDDALMVLAQEGGHVGSPTIGMSCVEQERYQPGISLCVKCFDLPHFRLKFPPVVVIGERQSGTLAECAGDVQAGDLSFQIVRAGRRCATENETLRPQRSPATGHLLIQRYRRQVRGGIPALRRKK
jgi:hypothetical protein